MIKKQPISTMSIRYLVCLQLCILANSEVIVCTPLHAQPVQIVNMTFRKIQVLQPVSQPNQFMSCNSHIESVISTLVCICIVSDSKDPVFLFFRLTRVGSEATVCIQYPYKPNSNIIACIIYILIILCIPILHSPSRMPTSVIPSDSLCRRHSQTLAPKTDMFYAKPWDIRKNLLLVRV